MNSDPLVSIVIPVFNQAGFIKRAIDSVLNQVCSFEVELIVIDDGSTDSVKNILFSYGDKIIWESRTNHGQAATLNYGWSKSRAEIIGYLSADDMLRPSAIDKLVNILVSNKSAVVAYGDFETVDALDNRIRYIHTADFSLREMLTHFECPPGPGALFRRKAFIKAGGWDTNLHRMPDFEFWLRMALQGDFVRIPEPLAMWRVHEGSQAFSSISVQRANEPILIIKNFFERTLAPSELVKLKSEAYASAFLVSAQLHARSKRYVIALSRFSNALKYNPITILSLRTWHIVLNALFQQPAHRLLSWMRSFSFAAKIEPPL